MVNSLVTFALCGGRPHQTLPQTLTISLFFLSQSIEAIFLEGVHVYFTKSFDVVMSDLY